MVWDRTTTEGGIINFVWRTVASEGISQTKMLTFAWFRNVLVNAMWPHIFRQLSVKGNLGYFPFCYTVFAFVC